MIGVQGWVGRDGGAPGVGRGWWGIGGGRGSG